MPTRMKGQLGLDEAVVDDAALEALLDARNAAAEARRAVAARFAEADEAARAALAELHLEPGAVVRIGAYRIEVATLEARHVEFDTEARTRLRIGTDTADDGTPDDDE
jgi:hypothetical protein